jgi:ABC-type lipoprotein export system ATPase subunit
LSVPVLHISRVRKKYQGLRPLRIEAFTVGEGERVTIAGLDGAAAELVVNLITGAALPDEGEVTVAGRRTSDISSGDEWLASLDRFGIVSPRAVMVEGYTLEQNLAMPFTLDVDPVTPDVAAQVRALAAECGIDAALLAMRAGDAPPPVRGRLHLARAVALGPSLLLVEHPTADVPAPDRIPLARDMARVCDRRRLPAVVMTNDDDFARAAAPRNLKLEGATGELKPVKRGWFR